MRTATRHAGRCWSTILAGAIAFATLAHPAGAEERRERPNVLFIAVDDLKPTLACFDDPRAITPGIDRIAAQGTVFLNTHCQQAVCAPSRVSLLTGLRPDTTEVWDLKTRFRDHIPDVVTLPQLFKNSGYEVVGMGKIFDPRSTEGREKMDAVSWSRPYIHPESPSDATFHYRDPELVAFFTEKIAEAEAAGIRGWAKQREFIGVRPTTDMADVPDEAYPDGALGARGVELIHELAGADQPFFLAVGFHKPHLPFNAPKRYWDLYDRDAISLHPFQQMPAGAPGFHYQDSWELRSGYTDPPEPGTPVPPDMQRRLIHGYYACVSYIDAQVGRLLDALDEAGVADNTVVVLWGDHGWHLGDHDMWCKHTNYEQATRSPLLIAFPGAGRPGGRCETPVEFVDIYPTLVDLCGLEAPHQMHGTTLRSVMVDPAMSVKPVAISQYPRNADGVEVMGYALRDDRYRYIEWREIEGGRRKGPGTGAVVARELYDYLLDPLETRNLIDDSTSAQVVERMERLAHEAGIGKAAKTRATRRESRSTRRETSTPAPVLAGEMNGTPTAGELPANVRWRDPDDLPVYKTTPQGDLRLHVFRPEGWSPDDSRSAILMYHGGGWNKGSPKAHYWHCIYLASRGMVAISAEYRTRDGHGVKAIRCVEDAHDAHAYVRQHATSLGIDPDRIALGGGSAGGHLAACTAVLDPGSERPAGLVLFNPVLSTVRKGIDESRLGADPESVSPLHHIRPGLPPMLIMNGDADTVTTIDTARAFTRSMIDAGNRCELVVYTGQPHSFFHPDRNDGKNFIDTTRRMDLFLASLGLLDGPPTIER
jgi:iduronate 2-sulfatase